MKRRRVLQGVGLAAIAGWVWGAPRLARLGQDPVTFTAIPGAEPFRQLDRASALSASAGIFAGLDAPAPQFTGALCPALFGGNDGLAIAYFSDVQCPNCPRMEAATRAAIGDQPIPLIRHELPLLGPRSVAVAKVFLAAKLQSAGQDIASILLGTPGPITPARLADIADRTGLDHQRWVADIDSATVANHLAQEYGVAARLGIYGTPGTVIGRTVILGALPEHQIAQIIATERQDNQVCG
ncbi:DsbA family protein [Yoonia sp. R2331]|uniref:DsbA family protein n=1 Tax=Yoonia sp. R2331 TaxID=3237238 RepID=UPI0034E4FC76